MGIAKRTDANQKEIVKTFRDMGASVLILSMVGKGCPDILVGYRGVNYLVEIKDGAKAPSAKKLTPAEQDFFFGWGGQVCIIESVSEAQLLLCSLQMA